MRERERFIIDLINFEIERILKDIRTQIDDAKKKVEDWSRDWKTTVTHGYITQKTTKYDRAKPLTRYFQNVRKPICNIKVTDFFGFLDNFEAEETPDKETSLLVYLFI